MTTSHNSAVKAQEVPKAIRNTAKLLHRISPNLATRFASRLFVTPIRHRVPKRELQMLEQSRIDKLHVPAIDKEVVVYQYGNSTRKILLVHGWSGRGTQLVKIADHLLEEGFSIVSFDAPAHGKAPGKTTIMTEFIAAIHEVNRLHGPFEYAVGHSLGGMSILNALREGLSLKKAVIIGSGDVIQDIIDDFVYRLGLPKDTALKIKAQFEKQYQTEMDYYSAYRAAQEVHIPVLVIHDQDDPEVSVKAAHHIDTHLKNSELMITHQLGHRKILGDKKVIAKLLNFIGN